MHFSNLIAITLNVIWEIQEFLSFDAKYLIQSTKMGGGGNPAIVRGKQSQVTNTTLSRNNLECLLITASELLLARH